MATGTSSYRICSRGYIRPPYSKGGAA